MVTIIIMMLVIMILIMIIIIYSVFTVVSNKTLTQQKGGFMASCAQVQCASSPMR
jgi:hypothetical protein